MKLVFDANVTYKLEMVDNERTVNDLVETLKVNSVEEAVAKIKERFNNDMKSMMTDEVGSELVEFVIKSEVILID